MAKEIKINIQMNGILIELSPEEAKSLYFELHQIFAKQEIISCPTVWVKDDITNVVATQTISGTKHFNDKFGVKY